MRPSPVWLSLLCATTAAASPTLNLPPRPLHAPAGSVLIQRLTPLGLEEREQEIFAQIAAGNVPDFLRQLCPVTTTNVASGHTNSATFYVAPDYLAVGSDTDSFLTPLTPATAQRIADLVHCSLPTRKVVDAIYAAAEVKLPPAPIPPSPAMTTMPVFAEHNAMVRTQRAVFLMTAPLGALVSGAKKDVVVTPKLATATNRVAIYGWHRTNGLPIQPLYLGHTAAWVDYSHGIRLVHATVQVNGSPRSLNEILANTELASLLSDEGAFTSSRYETNAIPPPTVDPDSASAQPSRTNYTLADFKPSPRFEEQTLSFTIAPGVKIHINAPTPMPANCEVLLVFYALPNGNTTAQTIGKVLNPGDDWHFDIQHIGAQTRWLRQHAPERPIVITYLENTLKSWPAWRKQHGDAGIPAILDTVKRIFESWQVKVVLTGHSGGGSLTFGYLNTVASIPDDVERIAFLDSNYAYDRGLHLDKLARWLSASDHHALCVLAYQDYVALLDGKPFVSERGGTWGKSHAMLEDLGAQFQFAGKTNSLLVTHLALYGRVQFLFRLNPERKIYHTVQVERNGFIHALLMGTRRESAGYGYFEERAYAALISPD